MYVSRLRTSQRAWYELQPTGSRPHLCIGTDATHTPRWLSEAAQAAFGDVGTIGENTPYSGCYVPLDRYGTDPRVSAVMLEIRRDRYLYDHGAVLPDAAEALGAMLGRFTDAAERGCR